MLNFAVIVPTSIFPKSYPAWCESVSQCAQVAALETLVKVATSPEAGLLGSSWVIILRCLSLLEALQVHHLDYLACMFPQVVSAYCSPCRCSPASACMHAFWEIPHGCQDLPAWTHFSTDARALQSWLPLASKEAAPKLAPGRQASAAHVPPSGGHAADGRQEQDTPNGQPQRGQSRAARTTGLGRFLSRMGMAGESVAPEV